jgi:hypothetical protein
VKVGEDDGTGSFGMPVIAEDLKTILGFYGIFVVACLNGAESAKVRTLTLSNMS